MSTSSETAEKSEKPAKKSGGRILELDAIRALTCLNLLFFHFTYVYQHKYGFASELGFSFPYGKYGVQLFFMLSGLVNALTLIKKRKPGEFIASRCIRILPSYWLVILLNIVLFSSLAMYNQTVGFGSTVANLSTLPRLFGQENMEPVTWTLQVEMLFYFFLMATFALGLLDRPIRTMMVAISICLVSCLTFDWYKSAFPESNWNSAFYVIDELFFMRTLPLFAMGILLNELRCKRGKPIHIWLGILASGIVFHLIDLREHNPVVTVLLMGMLTAAAYGKIPILRFKPLVFISFISYPLYLFHNNLGSALMKQVEAFGIAPIPTVIIATLFSIGVATLVTYWFEQPITRRLRKRFMSKPKTEEGRSSDSVEENVKVSDKSSESITIDPVTSELVDSDPINGEHAIENQHSFDSSECLDEVIEAQKLRDEIRKDYPNEDAVPKS